MKNATDMTAEESAVDVLTDADKLRISEAILAAPARSWPERRAALDRVLALDHAPECKSRAAGGPDVRCEYHRHGGSRLRVCSHDRFAAPARDEDDDACDHRYEWSA